MASFNHEVDPLSVFLQREKEIFLARNPHLSAETIEVQWMQRVSKAIASRTASTGSRSDHHGRHPYPRPHSQSLQGGSHSHGGASMMRQSSARRVSKSGTTRPRANSQQSAPGAVSMSRTDSLLSSGSAVPSTLDAHTRRALQALGDRPINDIDAWRNGDAPYNPLGSPAGARRMDGPPASALAQVTEIDADFGENPSTWLARNADDGLGLPSVSLLPSPTLDGFYDQTRPDPRHLSAGADLSGSLGSSFSDPHQWAGSQSTTELTNTTAATSDYMSRQPSELGSVMCQALDMLRFESAGAYARICHDGLNGSSEHFPSGGLPTDGSGSYTTPTVDDVLRGAGGAANYAPPYPSVGSNSTATPVAAVDAPAMERLESTGSNASTSSRRRQQQHLANSRRPIQPKSSPPDASAARSSADRPDAVRRSGGKVAISKSAHKRRETPPLTCEMCGPKSKTFKGDHELNRHTQREHVDVKRRWISRDMSQHKDALANCAKCRNRKTYGVDYNCAAHLRRTHFNPCLKGEAKKANPPQRRGGSGGGNWPPMEWMKAEGWMVEVVVDPSDPKTAPADAEPVHDDEVLDDVAGDLLMEDDDEDDAAAAAVAMEHDPSVRSSFYGDMAPGSFPSRLTDSSGAEQFPNSLNLHHIGTNALLAPHNQQPIYVAADDGASTTATTSGMGGAQAAHHLFVGGPLGGLDHAGEFADAAGDHDVSAAAAYDPFLDSFEMNDASAFIASSSSSSSYPLPSSYEDPQTRPDYSFFNFESHE